MASFLQGSDSEAIHNIVKSDSLSQFNDVQWHKIQDSNGGSYGSNQVIINASGIVNQKRPNIWSEAILYIPEKIVLTQTGGSDKSMAYGLGLKNGYFQILNNIQVDINGVSTVSQVVHQNLHAHVVMMIEKDDDWVKTRGATFGFIPDGNDFGGSSSYQSSHGLIDNDIGTGLEAPIASEYDATIQTLALAVTGNPQMCPAVSEDYQVGFNIGLLKRMQACTAFEVAAVQVGGLVTAANMLTVQRNNTVYTTRVNTYHFMRVIRLADYCDLFKRLDFPIAGAKMQFTLNLNVSSTVMGTAAINSPQLGLTTQTNSYSMCNYIITSVALQRASVTAVTVAQTIGNGMSTNCYLYVPSVVLTPAQAVMVASDSHRYKTIDYLKLHQFTLNTAGTAAVNWAVTSGVRNPIRLMVLPYLTASAAQKSLPAFGSPLNSCGATTTPFVQLHQIQVQVGGNNLKQLNDTYTFETFVQNILPELEGGLSFIRKNGGLINQHNFDNYKVYMYDLSRITASSLVSVAPSIQFNATILSSVGLDLIAFVEARDTVKIDLVTGLFELQT